MMIFQGKRVVILGAARQGLALARFLTTEGALVTLSDKQSSDQLQSSIDSLSDKPIEWVLGSHPLEMLDHADLVCVSGGVPLSLPIIKEAVLRGIPITNDSEIFMSAVKAPVVGITGSAGKTTTTTLVGRMAMADIKSPRRVWVGGNIGNPLIESIDEIKPDDLVILELSSFQLELMTTSPHLSAVLNITPNHLDRHGSMVEYTQAKTRILANQGVNDISVLNREDPGSWDLVSQVRGKLVSFGMQPTETSEPAVFIADGNVVLNAGGSMTILLPVSTIKLRGEHNLMNVLAACTIASAVGISSDSIQAGVEGFTGVAHRLELVRERKGVSWINDSIATTPERTLAAIHSYSEPIVLLLGGRDKDLPWDDLAKVIHQRVDHVVIFGEAGNKIASAIGLPRHGDQLESVSQKHTLIESLEEALHISSSGDVVLLSPGCTSYDAYRDFEERGEIYRQWVNDLS